MTQRYWGMCQVCKCPVLNSHGPMQLVNNLYVCRRHVEYAREIIVTPAPIDTPQVMPGPEWGGRETVAAGGLDTPPGQDFGTGELL